MKKNGKTSNPQQLATCSGGMCALKSIMDILFQGFHVQTHVMDHLDAVQTSHDYQWGNMSLLRLVLEIQNLHLCIWKRNISVESTAMVLTYLGFHPSGSAHLLPAPATEPWQVDYSPEGHPIHTEGS